MENHKKDISLSSSFTLPCGEIISNRIVKSAMSENMADRGYIPGEKLNTLYKLWADGRPGLLITGNIMVDKNALGEPRNVVVEDESAVEPLSKWVTAATNNETKIWGQINHPGRQAMKGVNKEIIAPSAIAVKTPVPGLFSKPRALNEEEIHTIINRYGNTALILKKAGFNGVQIHGAHGYLVSQFLSPLTNQRKDKWGGSLENRARFVVDIYKNIREKVGDHFAVGIKINSADFQRGGFSEEESIEVIRLLSNLKIDMIEISGGTYEKAAMMGASEKSSTIEREAYFMDYVEKARKTTHTPLLLTGGFRTVEAMNKALQEDKVDFIGIGRPFCIYPDLPSKLFSGKLDNIHYPSPKSGLKMVDNMGFLELLWCQMQIQRMGRGENPNTRIGLWPVMKKLVKGK